MRRSVKPCLGEIRRAEAMSGRMIAHRGGRVRGKGKKGKKRLSEKKPGHQRLCNKEGQGKNSKAKGRGERK